MVANSVAEVWELLQASKFYLPAFSSLEKYQSETRPPDLYHLGYSLGLTNMFDRFLANHTSSQVTSPDISGNHEPQQIVRALHTIHAVVEYDLDGTIIDANENFLRVMGYEQQEIVGKNHSMFMLPQEVAGSAYAEHWATLQRGQQITNRYRLITSDGSEVWLQASYIPILDAEGAPLKILKIATDVTEQAWQAAEYKDQVAAISHSLAVIEFNLDGTIVTANENFQKTTGYSLNEIRDQHHRLFVDPAEHNSSAYLGLWETLNRGEYVNEQFRRVKRNGDTLWLQAIYSPVFDPNGKPIKVVKYASDITDQKLLSQALDNLVKEAGEVMGALAEGDLTRMMQGVHTGELAELSEAINATVEQLKLMMSQVTEHSSALVDSSEKLSALNDSSHEAAVRTAEQTERSSSTASQISSSVASVAVSLGEMTNAIHGIARNSSDAVTVADKAVALSEEAKSNVSQLAESSNGINAVIKVINSIADQTNLLALNATIEAARAGDAGRGFAVVANEVKELAKETARATEDVSQKIAKIQNDSQIAERIISEINTTIENISASQVSIASTVEEQRAMSSQISDSLNETARGSTEIADSAAKTADVARNNLERLEQSRETTRGLQERSNKLGELAASFSLGRE